MQNHCQNTKYLVSIKVSRSTKFPPPTRITDTSTEPSPAPKMGINGITWFLLLFGVFLYQASNSNPVPTVAAEAVAEGDTPNNCITDCRAYNRIDGLNSCPETGYNCGDCLNGFKETDPETEYCIKDDAITTIADILGNVSTKTTDGVETIPPNALLPSTEKENYGFDHIGIAFGGICAVALAIFLLILVCRYFRNKKRNPTNVTITTPSAPPPENWEGFGIQELDQLLPVTRKPDKIPQERGYPENTMFGSTSPLCTVEDSRKLIQRSRSEENHVRAVPINLHENNPYADFDPGQLQHSNSVGNLPQLTSGQVSVPPQHSSSEGHLLHGATGANLETSQSASSSIGTQTQDLSGQDSGFVANSSQTGSSSHSIPNAEELDSSSIGSGTGSTTITPDSVYPDSVPQDFASGNPSTSINNTNINQISVSFNCQYLVQP